MADGTKLVIVESPTKARTIRKFLSNEYRVEASMGHVRDLPASGAEIPAELKAKPWARIGVDVENGFRPIYVIPGGKKRVVAELRKALEKAQELYLATDEDREGESIGWHLVEVLKPKVPIRRMVFHEITKTAIQQALQNPRALNDDLVNAQETRRVLDRLVGYTVSPLLWKKVAPKLSAGRVQSVAVRLLVMRERERMAFKSASYWDLQALVRHASGQTFQAQLLTLDGKRIATGRDFDENTGKLAPGKDVLLLGEEHARRLAQQLEGRPLRVVSLETRQQNRSPQPPFTTSTLQQEANRKLGLSAQRTMRIAQRLYEQGHITYMRTDSTNLAESAVEGIRAMVAERYGQEYLHPNARTYRTSSKGAQEAHEAIRPAGTAMPTAAELGLVAEQAKLYELIWKRTVACQMADARLAFTTVQLEANTETAAVSETATFRASGREVLFPGFFRAYVEGSEDPAEALEDQSQPLPSLKEGEELACDGVEPLQHDTKPPARYTEASLVKALESYGIGRPSTYASIIDTIQRRGYVMAKNKQLVPTFTSLAVTQLLEEALARVVDVDFTAAMEEKLDEIAEGKDALEYLTDFYHQQLLKGVQGGLEVDAREVCMVRAPNLGPYGIRVGRYGAFVEYSTGDGGTATVSLPADAAPSDVDQAYVERLVALARRGREPLGKDPESGQPVFVLVGPYGPYLQLGEVIDPKDRKNRPKRVSIPPSMDPLAIDLDQACKLLALPRRIGDHPETGKVIRAGIGRFGPYVVHDHVYASLKPEDDVLTVGVERALELLAGKKPRRRASDPLKELGAHPEDGEPVRVMNGPYGAYVKHGKLNASIPEGFDVEDVTLDEAVVWLEEKAARRGLREPKGEGAAEARPAPRRGRKEAGAGGGVAKAASKKKTATRARGDGAPAKAAKTAKKTTASKSKKSRKTKKAKKVTRKAPGKKASANGKTSARAAAKTNGKARSKPASAERARAAGRDPTQAEE